LSHRIGWPDWPSPDPSKSQSYRVLPVSDLEAIHFDVAQMARSVWSASQLRRFPD
jgi:hypothetical protein